MAKTDVINGAVIGYGGAFNMGLLHLQWMQKAGITPYAACDIDPDRVEAATTDIPGIKTFTKLTLSSDDGASVPLTKAELGEDSIPFVKLNRKGQLRFRLYKKQGDGFTSGADLRSLTRIKVE